MELLASEICNEHALEELGGLMGDAESDASLFLQFLAEQEEDDTGANVEPMDVDIAVAANEESHVESMVVDTCAIVESIPPPDLAAANTTPMTKRVLKRAWDEWWSSCDGSLRQSRRASVGDRTLQALVDQTDDGDATRQASQGEDTPVQVSDAKAIIEKAMDSACDIVLGSNGSQKRDAEQERVIDGLFGLESRLLKKGQIVNKIGCSKNVLEEMATLGPCLAVCIPSLKRGLTCI